jgi:hypothetical protein
MSDGMPTHELDLVVGSMITVRPDEDQAMYNEEKAWLEEVQDLLREDGIEVDLVSRPGTEVWEGGIESFNDLYLLRRLAAHAERGGDIAAVAADTSDEDEVDPLLADIWEGTEQTKFIHLISHQGEGGYYLPVDFSEPIWLSYGDEEEEASEDEEWNDEVVSFGSSVALMRELTELETVLNAAGGASLGSALATLNTLREAAKQSMEHQLPIILW